ncbi:MAG TPA: roadblock/LC7 domain-containing protein [Longimicrobium sp.]|nr:roadblock/LC7 domain-containing protein [Longimicrobium sp.]
MSELDTALEAFLSHPGVEHILLLGRDGLLIQHAGAGGLDADTVSAMVPGLASTGAALGEAAGLGEADTVVVRMAGGVAVVAVLSAEVLLAVFLRGGVGFARLLAELAERRPALAALV